MGDIYVVSCHFDYEGSDPIKAFSSMPEAEAFVAELHAYDATRPVQPRDTGDEEKDQRRFERHWRRWERWNKAHPAGEGNASSYPITKIELVPTTQGADHDH